ncbi:Bpu10I family restriction endonuclease [Kocuria sp.]|uniref:Bpu10I family restriction endonuclease n=1 Tax=Kocuria sp. TaxID=1871328 RepID=UPI0026DFE46E|nr:Bpu10I family restriction endonuclease [Kocuria sp.]MDO5617273.1 Bpu10I family restriction endonuclease [Kocuria sp.]
MREDQDAFEETVPVEEVAAAPYRRPTPHGDKLRELVNNAKLPGSDLPKVESLVRHYAQWIEDMSNLTSTGDAKVEDLVGLLNAYKEKIEVDLIWDSDESFLYRQKGQLKLDNSVLEEWFPWLVDPVIMPELGDIDLVVGPAKAFAAARFQSALTDGTGRPGLVVRSKDQDFTIGRPAYMKASFSSSFDSSMTDEVSTYVAYIAAELKTNLDKTMFQEASATSHDLTIAAPGSHYFLICEYLDMTPISSAGTDISEVLVLRGKRTGSQDRKNYSNARYRRENRQAYVARLRNTPVRTDVVLRFVHRVRAILQNQTTDLSDAVERGYF